MTIRHRTIRPNDVDLHIAEAGEGPLVLLLHGWPESWYSWRHQLPALAAAGYHAVAPSARGFGDSGKPDAIDAYSMRHHVSDAVGVLDALHAPTAVVVGHDFGAAVAWHSAALHPDRFRAVVGMSIPHAGRPPAPPTQIFKAMLRDAWFYIVHFQAPGVVEAELDADVATAIRTILTSTGLFTPVRTKPPGAPWFAGVHPPAALPAWLTEHDITQLARGFIEKGFRPSLGRYRNLDRDWHEYPQLATAKLAQPALFIVGELDPVRAFTPVDTMKALVPRLKPIRIIPGAGHWIQQERPADVNAALLAFLNTLPR